MNQDHEDRLRASLAFLKCLAVGDKEGQAAIANFADLAQLAEDLGLLAVGFIGLVNDQPADHIDKMFKAADVAGGLS